MSLSAMAAALEAENARLQAEVAVLRSRLELTTPVSAEIELMVRLKLTRAEASLLTALIAARPCLLDRYSLEAAMPARDHAGGRDVQIVDVQLSKLRKKIGPGAIENVNGIGWRLSDSWAA